VVDRQVAGGEIMGEGRRGHEGADEGDGSDEFHARLS